MFEKNKMKYDFYLAGKMRGCKDLNKPLFISVAQRLRAQEFTVWSPAEQKSYLQSSFAECMTLDLNAVINECRKIAFLPGWRKSLGANGEAFSAFLCGKEAVEVVFGNTVVNGIEDMDLKPVDLSNYHLPYSGEQHQFNPHDCSVDADQS